jgi:hypothetical protein
MFQNLPPRCRGADAREERPGGGADPSCIARNGFWLLGWTASPPCRRLPGAPAPGSAGGWLAGPRGRCHLVHQHCYRSKLAGAPAAAAELGGRTRYLRHHRLVGPLPLAHQAGNPDGGSSLAAGAPARSRGSQAGAPAWWVAATWPTTLAVCGGLGAQPSAR